MSWADYGLCSSTIPSTSIFSPFTGAIAVPSGFFDDANLAHIVGSVQCQGSEMQLLDCVHNASASVDSTCGELDDASVVCQGMYNYSWL